MYREVPDHYPVDQVYSNSNSIHQMRVQLDLKLLNVIELGLLDYIINILYYNK